MKKRNYSVQPKLNLALVRKSTIVGVLISRGDCNQTVFTRLAPITRRLPAVKLLLTENRSRRAGVGEGFGEIFNPIQRALINYKA